MVAMVPIFFFGLVFAIGWVVVTLSERRLTIAQNVVRQITMVTSQNIPLATGLMLAGQGEPGKSGLILRRIASLVAAGLPLSEAVAQGYPASSGFINSVIHAGERAGRLPAALKMLQTGLEDQIRNRARALPLGLTYAWLLTFVVALIWTGMMVVIVPKFKEIFSDFGVRIPSLTVALMRLSDALMFSSLGLLLLLGLVLGIPVIVHWTVRPRRAHRPRVTSQIADHLRWSVPGLRRLEFARGMTSIASLLRVFVEAGMTLERATRLASQTDVNIVLRRRFEVFAKQLELGSPPPTAADHAGLGTVFAAALRAGQHGDRLGTSLNFVADYYRALNSRFWIVVRSVAWPLITIALALMVGTFVTAMFLPMVSLLNGVLESM